MRRTGLKRRRVWLGVVCALALTTLSGRSSSVAPGDTARREFQIVAADFAFTPARIEVTRHDIVRIHLHARDIAHSFVVDAYRVAKRAGAGETVVTEFHASEAGTFPFYCNLTIDRRCEHMRGELVVRP